MESTATASGPGPATAPHPAAVAAAAEPPAARPGPQLTLKQRSQLRVDYYCFIITIAGHLSHWIMLLHMADTKWKRMQPVLPLAAMVLGAAVITCLPTYYARHRNWLLPVMRVLVVLPPSARNMRVGAAFMLERPPRPGWRGALNDAFALLPGTRTLVGFMQGSVNALPPSISLLTQAAMVCLTANPSGYCATEMLSATLTRQRMDAAAAALEFASLPLVALQPLSGRAAVTPAAEVLAGRAPSGPLCHCAVQFYMVFMGVLVPVLISVWGWQPPSAAPAAASGSGETAERLPLLQRLAHRGSRALAASDRMLHAVAFGGGLPGGRLLALWYITCSAWLWCRLTAGLGP